MQKKGTLFDKAVGYIAGEDGEEREAKAENGSHDVGGIKGLIFTDVVRVWYW